MQGLPSQIPGREGGGGDAHGSVPGAQMSPPSSDISHPCPLGRLPLMGTVKGLKGVHQPQEVGSCRVHGTLACCIVGLLMGLWEQQGPS